MKNEIALNGARGEVAVYIGDKPYKMVLDFGAMCALETAFGAFDEMTQLFSPDKKGKMPKGAMNNMLQFLKIVARSNHEDGEMPFVPVGQMRFDQAPDAFSALMESLPAADDVGKPEAGSRKKKTN